MWAFSKVQSNIIGLAHPRSNCHHCSRVKATVPSSPYTSNPVELYDRGRVQVMQTQPHNHQVRISYLKWSQSKSWSSPSMNSSCRRSCFPIPRASAGPVWSRVLQTGCQPVWKAGIPFQSIKRIILRNSTFCQTWFLLWSISSLVSVRNGLNDKISHLIIDHHNWTSTLPTSL